MKLSGVLGGGVLGLMVWLGAGCVGGGTGAERQGEVVAEAGEARPGNWVGEWRLVEWVGAGAMRREVLGMTLEVGAEGRVSGDGGVNRYAGEVEVGTSGAVVWSERFMSTKRAGPPAAMEAETAFLRELRMMYLAELGEDGALRLSGDGGLRMRFLRME